MPSFSQRPEVTIHEERETRMNRDEGTAPDDIVPYHIPYVLPLSLNTTASVFNQLNEVDEIVRQLALSSEEILLLKHILDAAPHPCSPESLLQALQTSCEETRPLRTLSSQEREEMRTSLRQSLSRLKQKILPFQLTLLSVYEVGYLVTDVNYNKRGEQGQHHEALFS